MGFVENFPISSAVTSRFTSAGIPITIAPGIELDNPDTSINGGNISVLTNWNLGAGTTDSNGNITLAFRFNGQAPIITFRAENDVKVDASLSDGFFQIANPIDPSSPTTVTIPGYSSFAITHENYYDQATGPFAGTFSDGVQDGTLAYYGVKGPAPQYAGVDVAPSNVTGTMPANSKDTVQGEIDEYLALYQAYAISYWQRTTHRTGTRASSMRS